MHFVFWTRRTVFMRLQIVIVQNISQRLFSGSLPILPLQDYYNEITEEEQPESSAVQIPEHLIDPIDLRLFLDPVVLPTSGRTVSKHTIVNNKWRGMTGVVGF